MTADPALVEHSMMITIPANASGPDDAFEQIEFAVVAAIKPLGSSAMLDGTGHGDNVSELFLYTNDADALIEAMLTVEFPPGTQAAVEIDDPARRRRKRSASRWPGTTRPSAAESRQSNWSSNSATGSASHSPNRTH